jgi:DNA-binding NarL/FixJ family response regulator
LPKVFLEQKNADLVVLFEHLGNYATWDRRTGEFFIKLNQVEINVDKSGGILIDNHLAVPAVELLELLPEQPAVVFTTAYDEYALKAFETNALDYLLKPFSHERFKQAINKWLQNSVNPSTSKVSLTEIPHKQPEEQNRIVIKDGSEISIIPTSELEYLEAYDDYVKIHHKGKVHLKKKTMNSNGIMMISFIGKSIIHL